MNKSTLKSEILAEFENHIKSSIPILDKFEIASLLNKLSNAIDRTATETAKAGEIKEMKDFGGIPLPHIEVAVHYFNAAIAHSKVAIKEFMEN